MKLFYYLSFFSSMKSNFFNVIHSVANIFYQTAIVIAVIIFFIGFGAWVSDEKSIRLFDSFLGCLFSLIISPFEIIWHFIKFIWNIYYDRNKNKIEGKKAEKQVAKILDAAPKDCYISLNDLFFNEFCPTQIDHILLSLLDIYVIETKSREGSIAGNIQSQTWAVTYGNGNSEDFYSPVIQNTTHIKILRELIENQFKVNLSDKLFCSIIAISMPIDATLNIDGNFYPRGAFYYDAGLIITRLEDLENAINTYEGIIYNQAFNQTYIFTQQDITKIYNYLSSINIMDKKKRKENNKRIQEKYQG